MRQYVYQGGQARAVETDAYHFLEKLDSGTCAFIHVCTCVCIYVYTFTISV